MVVYAQFVLGHFSSCFAVDGGPNALGLHLSYSYEDALHFLEIRDHQQLFCYKRFISVWDTIFPMVYTTMYISWLAVLFRNWKWLSLIPIVRIVSDWVENYVEIMMVDHYLNYNILDDHLVSWGAAMTSVKWGLSLVVYGIILYGVVRILWQKFNYQNEC